MQAPRIRLQFMPVLIGCVLLLTLDARAAAPLQSWNDGPTNGLPISPFGTFSQSTMDEAKKSVWLVINMKYDWARIFAFEE